jgi:hypothetical protein
VRKTEITQLLELLSKRGHTCVSDRKPKGLARVSQKLLKPCVMRLPAEWLLIRRLYLPEAFRRN